MALVLFGWLVGFCSTRELRQDHFKLLGIFLMCINTNMAISVIYASVSRSEDRQLWLSINSESGLWWELGKVAVVQSAGCCLYWRCFHGACTIAPVRVPCEKDVTGRKHIRHHS